METTYEPGTEVVVLNRHGGEIFGPSTGHTATVSALGALLARKGETYVRVQPSYRPGMPHDLISYPTEDLMPLSEVV